MRRAALALLGTLCLPLAGCDLLGIESASAVAARREAEGKAIGGACRHAARSIEQCYAANKRADKAAVFAGWREMNDYMRENNIEAMPGPAEPGTAARDEAAERSDGDAGPAEDERAAKPGAGKAAAPAKAVAAAPARVAAEKPAR